MAVTYAPVTHVAPITATVSGTNIDGMCPGRVFVALNDPYAPTSIYLPTAITADGYPTGMLPFTTGTGTVT